MCERKLDSMEMKINLGREEQIKIRKMEISQKNK